MKSKVLLVVPFLLLSCNKKQEEVEVKNEDDTYLIINYVEIKNEYDTFSVIGYVYSYQTSEVQEYTHDCRLATFKDYEDNMSYVEVDANYDETFVDVVKSDKKIYYRVYDIEKKVSDNGWKWFYK